MNLKHETFRGWCFEGDTQFSHSIQQIFIKYPVWIGFNNQTSHTLFLHLLGKLSLFLLFFLLSFIRFLECALSLLYLEMIILSNLVTFLAFLNIKYLNTIFTIYLCRLLIQTGELSLLLGVTRSQFSMKVPCISSVREHVFSFTYIGLPDKILCEESHEFPVCVTFPR